jgi:hypothetical protein
MIKVRSCRSTPDQPQNTQTSRGLGCVFHPAQVGSQVLPPQV